MSSTAIAAQLERRRSKRATRFAASYFTRSTAARFLAGRGRVGIADGIACTFTAVIVPIANDCRRLPWYSRGCRDLMAQRSTPCGDHLRSILHSRSRRRLHHAVQLAAQQRGAGAVPPHRPSRRALPAIADAVALRAASERAEAGADPASAARHLPESDAAAWLDSRRAARLARRSLAQLSWLPATTSRGTGAAQDAEPIALGGGRAACMPRDRRWRAAVRRDDTDAAMPPFGGGRCGRSRFRHPRRSPSRRASP